MPARGPCNSGRLTETGAKVAVLEVMKESEGRVMGELNVEGSTKERFRHPAS